MLKAEHIILEEIIKPHKDYLLCSYYTDNKRQTTSLMNLLLYVFNSKEITGDLI